MFNLFIRFQRDDPEYSETHIRCAMHDSFSDLFLSLERILYSQQFIVAHLDYESLVENILTTAANHLYEIVPTLRLNYGDLYIKITVIE